MSKFFIILFILFLILSTAIVKNSTKRIDDEIFVLRESIRSLKKDFQNVKLEHDYLSSAEKLLEFQNLYFDSRACVCRAAVERQLALLSHPRRASLRHGEPLQGSVRRQRSSPRRHHCSRAPQQAPIAGGGAGRGASC